MTKYNINASHPVDPGSEVALPPELEEVVKSLPPGITRKRAAQAVTDHLFPVSNRSMERWRLAVRHINGYAIISPREVFRVAYTKFAEAPVLKGGRQFGKLDSLEQNNPARG